MQGQMLIPEDFPARIRAGRAYAELSQADLARELGMSAGYVKMVEAGKGLKDLEARSLLERLPEITGLPRAFFAGEDGGDGDKLAEILTVLRKMEDKVDDRYDMLSELIEQRKETERRIRHMSAEEADEMIRMLQESRSRLGRDVGRRSLPAADEPGHRAAR